MTPKHNPASSTTITGTSAPSSEDVVVNKLVTGLTIADDGTVDEAAESAATLKVTSIKEALDESHTLTSGSIEGGDPGLPKDATTFLRGVGIGTQAMSYLGGFRAFMTAVKLPTDDVLLGPAAESVTTNWPLLLRLVPAALAGINRALILSLLARRVFLDALGKHFSTLSERIATVQSHVDDQLASQLRLIYDRCQTLLLTHDDLIHPFEPLVKFFTNSGKKALDQRINNQKVAANAVSNAAASETGHEPTPPSPPPGIVVPPGTVVSPGTGVSLGTGVSPGTVKAGKKAAATPAAPKIKKGRSRT